MIPLTRAVVVVVAVVVAAAPARADGTLLTDTTWRYRPGGDLVVDGGLAVALPAALPVGLSTGVGIGVSRGRGLVLGARAAWLTTTEGSTAWTVTHRDLRLRLTGAVTQQAGRGTVGLRLGVGGTLVDEHRVRNQGRRAGLTGTDLEATAWAMLPAADLDVVIDLPVTGAWGLHLGGGPTVDIVDGSVNAGWATELGVSWRP